MIHKDNNVLKRRDCIKQKKYKKDKEKKNQRGSRKRKYVKGKRSVKKTMNQAERRTSL